MSNVTAANEAPHETDTRTRVRPKQALLRARDVANWLDISEWRVYDLVRQNLIPCVKMGRSIRFRPEAIERWLEQGGSDLEGN